MCCAGRSRPAVRLSGITRPLARMLAGFWWKIKIGSEETLMRPITKIVIVGGGTSGWLAAAILSQHFKSELCRIDLVESAGLGTIGIGESTVPPFVGLIRRLG